MEGDPESCPSAAQSQALSGDTVFGGWPGAPSSCDLAGFPLISADLSVAWVGGGALGEWWQ